MKTYFRTMDYIFIVPVWLTLWLLGVIVLSVYGIVLSLLTALVLVPNLLCTLNPSRLLAVWTYLKEHLEWTFTKFLK